MKIIYTTGGFTREYEIVEPPLSKKGEYNSGNISIMPTGVLIGADGNRYVATSTIYATHRICANTGTVLADGQSPEGKDVISVKISVVTEEEDKKRKIEKLRQEIQERNEQIAAILAETE